MKFVKPSGAIVSVTATISAPNAGEMFYTPTSTTWLDEAGIWTVQGFVTGPGTIYFPTSIQSFVVAENS